MTTLIKPSGGTVLVTGAAGYIGSHTCIALLEAGYDILAIDNLCNSSRESLRRVERIAGKGVRFIDMDVRDTSRLRSAFAEHSVKGVIHFAGLKAVGESVSDPLKYYENNVAGTISLVQEMRRADVYQLVFSSSATVYGDAMVMPISEDAPLAVTNPYGASKLMVENILSDLVASDPKWQIGVLRYFNPVGAHPSGLIGEHPNGVPNNLMPYIAQVAVGKREKLSVFGNDYPTADGTGVRDYIHVMDLARGHVAAMAKLQNGNSFTVNLGTGEGYSVLELVRTFESASGKEIPLQMVARRPGDVARCFADPRKALEVLGWSAKHTLEEMCADHWRWQRNNPDGFIPSLPQQNTASGSTSERRRHERRLHRGTDAAIISVFGERRRDRKNLSA